MSVNIELLPECILRIEIKKLSHAFWGILLVMHGFRFAVGSTQSHCKPPGLKLVLRTAVSHTLHLVPIPYRAFLGFVTDVRLLICG